MVHTQECPTVWRLPDYHVETLRHIARGTEESEAGIHTSYLPDELERQGPPPDEVDPVYLHSVERFCERFQCLDRELINIQRRLIARARRALTKLYLQRDYQTPAVLHMTYGYPDPATRAWPKNVHDFLGAELVQLIRYTEATEDIRQRLVRDELFRYRDPKYTGFALRRCDVPIHNAEFQDETGLELQEISSLVNITDTREREAYADKIITSGDALRFIFQEFNERAPVRSLNEDKAAFRERSRPYETRRDAYRAHQASYLVEARAQAETMFTRASRAYHTVWLQSAVS